MANWFESVTKTLADGKLSRRGAMKTAAGITAAAALASLIPGQAFAASLGAGKNACSSPGSCSTPFSNCRTNPNCYCFTHFNTKRNGVCGCNTYCSSAQTCANQAGCPTGYFCITSTGCGCTTGVCVHKCNNTCVLDSSRSGRTAA